jgi:hypothetical protein
MEAKHHHMNSTMWHAACPHVPIVQTLPVRVIDPSSVVDITGCATTPVTAQATRPRGKTRTMAECMTQKHACDEFIVIVISKKNNQARHSDSLIF